MHLSQPTRPSPAAEEKANETQVVLGALMNSDPFVVIDYVGGVKENFLHILKPYQLWPLEGGNHNGVTMKCKKIKLPIKSFSLFVSHRRLFSHTGLILVVFFFSLLCV